jgi:uncharacterized protein YcfJ
MRDNLFGLDFSEKLAEENLRHIRTFINMNYKGEEKDAVAPFLKEKYVEIINDYIRVILDKYKIDKDKIIKKLENLNVEENNENLKAEEDKEEELNMFIKSLDEHEQLYYDLLVQSIVEAPESGSNLKSWANSIGKIFKKILGGIVGTTIASLTGSKILTAIAGGISAGIIISDINDIYIKTKYYSHSEFRRLYHINQRNSYDKRWNILKRIVKKNVTKIVNPIKRTFYYIVDKKILKINEETKVGFDNFDVKKNINEYAKICFEKIKDNFLQQYKNKIEFKYKKKILEIKKKFETKDWKKL